MVRMEGWCWGINRTRYGRKCRFTPTCTLTSTRCCMNEVCDRNPMVYTTQVQFAIIVSGTYGTPEGTFLFQYLSEKKSKQKELERKSKQ